MNPKQYQALSHFQTYHLSSFHSKKRNEISIENIQIGSYVSCLYQREWYDGINEEVSVEENDVLVKFLHPTDPSVYLHWPATEVKCWVPVNQRLQLLVIPTVRLQGTLIPS